MTQGSFSVLKEIGALELDGNYKVKFSIDAYLGHRYASIRKYLTEGSYTGATKIGITLTPDIVRALAPLLASLPDDPKQLKEVNLGKFAKKPGVSVIVRISCFQGTLGLDFRQWQENENYKGWTKNGIRLPVDKIKEIKILFAKMAEGMQEMPIIYE